MREIFFCSSYYFSARTEFLFWKFDSISFAFFSVDQIHFKLLHDVQGCCKQVILVFWKALFNYDVDTLMHCATPLCTSMLQAPKLLGSFAKIHFLEI